jgi:hypothetical protein
MLPCESDDWGDVEDWCIQQAAEKLRRDVDNDIMNQILEKAAEESYERD